MKTFDPIPFLHAACCGALLLVLAGSGWGAPVPPPGWEAAPPPGSTAIDTRAVKPARGLRITEVRLRFLGNGGRQTVGFFQLGQTLPPLEAQLSFRGSGLLRARWELVQPGDSEPTALDLTPEANLTAAQRAQQRRWRLLQRVQTALPPAGLTIVPGPNPRLLPTDRAGIYTVLLRIEPGDTPAQAADAAAPLRLPVLRYVVGEAAVATLPGSQVPVPIEVVAPQGLVFSDRPLVFSWLQAQRGHGAALYRLEIERNGQPLYAARVLPDAPGSIVRFTLPGFAQAQLGGAALRWRVVSLRAEGGIAAASRWVDIQPATVK